MEICFFKLSSNKILVLLDIHSKVKKLYIFSPVCNQNRDLDLKSN